MDDFSGQVTVEAVDKNHPDTFVRIDLVNIQLMENQLSTVLITSRHG